MSDPLIPNKLDIKEREVIRGELGYFMITKL
jgi:hypothetical protein